MSYPKISARHRALTFSATRRLPRVLAGIVSGALVAAALVVGLGGTVASATSIINLSAPSDASILAGQQAKVTLKASNPGTAASDNLYNLSYSYELPEYVTYNSGSTAPDTVGEPTIVTITDVPAQVGPPAVAAITHQVLIWSNASDLPYGDSASFTFRVTADPTKFPVGATLAGTAANAYANADPRMLPKFSSTTGLISSGYTASGTATPATTAVAAIKLTKSEPSPETELMRGVHDQTTVYTLTATNTNQAATNTVIITDEIPAQLEFLGCGGMDNSAFRTAEYPGSGTLSGTPNPGVNCLAPASVTTVQNPGSLTGVFTQVTWSIGNLAANQTVVITYAAGIPLKENTMSWDSSAGAGHGTTPATTGAQGSNLDNNNGSLTRQIASGSTLTNTASAAGDYQGAVKSGTSSHVTSSTTFTNKIMDLSIVKTESTITFNAGHTVNFSLLLRASEYEDDRAMTIVDTIPNGLCPLIPAGITPQIDAGADNPAECQTVGTVDNATIQSVEAKSDGTWIVTMTPDLSGTVLTHNDDLTITYTAFMRTNYQGSTTAPTAAGDTFQNKVIIDGTSSSITDTAPTDQAVHDDSAATLGSSAPTIQKLILPRPAASGSAVDCSTATGYIDNHTYPLTGTLPVYQLGDKICFELIVDYSTSTLTRNSQVQDFVPTGTTYQGYSVAASSTVPAGQVSAPDITDPNSPIFSIGATQPGDSSGDLFVAKGAVLTMFVSAVVTSTSPNTTVDITANLMKYRQESTANTVLALRYAANYGIAPAPTVSLNKTATLKNGAAVTGNSDNVLVKEGDTLTSAITVTNTGTSVIGNDFAIDNVVIWDGLPAGITCANFDSASNSGACTNPDDPLHPVLADTTVSTIVWTLPATVLAAQNEQVTYTLHIAAGTSVSRSFTNTASVVDFQSINSNGGQTDYYPLGSLNPAHNTDGNTTKADDTAKFFLTDVSVTKTASPEITETNKSASQVVNGEKVDFTYSATVPAHSTVYNGKLTDTMPTGLSIPAGATITANLAGTVYTIGSMPTGWTLGTDGKLTFPTALDNTSGTDAVYSVTILGALVSPSVATGGLTNTGKFDSTTTSDPSSTPITTRSGAATVTVVAPNPTFTKTVSPTTASAGQTVTYTLVAGNAVGAPAAWDGVITDCLPAGIAFAAFLSAPSGTTTASAPGDGTPATGNCASGSTYLTWTLPATTGILSTATVTITFSATVATSAAGLHTYSNTALLTASSLNDGANNSANEKVVTKTSSAAVVTVNGATVAKTITSATPTVIGSTVNYQAVVTLPANVNFYNAAIIDTLPATSGAVQYVANSAAITCVTAETTPGDCAENTDLPGHATGYALSSFPTTGTVTKIGWLLGSIPSQTYVRTVTVTYSVVVQDFAGAARGNTETNSATLSWTDQSASAPTNAGSAFAHSATASPASFTLQAPNVIVAKTVNNAASLSAAPGSTFTYRIVASNDNNTNGAIAYDTVVTDTIPTGIVVDRSSISGTFTASPASGVVTSITWQVGTIAKNASATTLSYNATLADSTTLTTSTLNNSAVASSYKSLEGAGHTYGPSVASVAAVTPSFPKVTLGKSITSGSTTAYVGSPLTYALTMTNSSAAGTGTATSVTPTDVLPANWILVGTPTITTTTAGVTTSPSSFLTTSSAIASGVQTLVWSAITGVLPGQVITISYQAQPTSAATTSPGAGSSILHTNTFTAVTTDPTGATHYSGPTAFTTNQATASAHIDKADLSITKAAGGALVAGQTTTNAWTLTVKDSSTSDTAVGPFTVTDTPTLPTGLTINSASGTGWSCTTSGSDGSFTCSRSNANDTLAANATFPVINISVSVAADVASATSADNTATVSATTFDPTTNNNTSSKTISVTTSADLAITKTANGTFTAGGTASWTLGVQNLGSSIARYPITVVDTLPTSGIDTTTAVGTGTDWSCTTGVLTITCTYNGPGGVGSGLAIGSTPAITVTAAIPSNVTATISNSATVSSPTTDPVSSNNSSNTTTLVSSSTSLSTTKTLVTSPFVAGMPVTYELVVTNNGTPDARTVVINDPLPAGLTYSSFSSVAGAWTCSDNGTGGVSNAHCTLSGNLQGTGGTNVATVRITAATSPSLTGGVLNTATVGWANSGTAQGSSNGTTSAKADLQLTKTHPTGAVLAGNDVTYTLSVHNAGPSDSPVGVTVKDTLPAGLTYGTVSGTGWSCAAPVGQLVTCTSTAIIANGATANDIQVVAHIPSSGGPATYTNAADVTGVIDDPDSSNNHADDPTVVTDSAILSITKVVAGGATTWVAGTDITYTVSVTNSGPSDAGTVSVTDTLPSGLSMVSISSADVAWACSNTTFACTRPAMAPSTSTITVVAHIAASVAQGTLKTNTATVQWTDSRPTPNTATATADVTVQAHDDLKIVKTPATQSVNAGDDATFTLAVSNLGTSDAVGPVTITDILPIGIRYSSNSFGWTCTPVAGPSTATQEVDCALGDGTVGVSAGGSALSLVMVTTTDPMLGSVTLTNAASTTSPTTDSVPGNNSATATVTFGQSAELSITKTHVGHGVIGTNMTFTITVSNAGPSVAQNVVVTDTLHNGLTWVGFAGSDPAWACTPGTVDIVTGNTPVTCDLTGMVAAGSSAPTLLVQAEVTSVGYPTVDNHASVASSTPDPDSTNNAVIDPVTVDPQVNLSITKTHIGQLVVGQNSDYLITVSNAGPTEDPSGFTVVDTMPTGLTYVSFAGTGVTCAEVSGTVTCAFTGTLATGASRSVTLTTAVDQAAFPRVVNSATVSTVAYNLGTLALTDSDTAPVDPKVLAFTGSQVSFLLWGILILSALITGFALFLIGRRRRQVR
ncbi:MAG: hypothetical protein JWN80_171 [Microbacteriaceae bacterium]|nr:hypothetical protein [Microbacteriaceae bacterium]